MSNGHDYLFALTTDNEAIGFIHGHENGKNKYISSGIYVCPEYRRQGIGFRLKEMQISLAKQLHCALLRTTVETQNEASLALQKKFNATFKPTAEPNIEVEIELQ